MYLSDHDLKQFVPHTLAPEKLARLLTEKVVEVEALHRWELDNVVVGEVRAINPHPQADRLRLVETSVGDRTLTIVCGGRNLYAGERVAVALEGAMVRWHGQGDKVKLEPATIRGIKSEGMICAAVELDLPIADRGTSPQPSPTLGEGVGDGPFILDLTRFIPNAKAGTPFAKALGLDDVRYEIDNKSLARRADLWGYQGMSREVALITGGKMKEAELEPIKYSLSLSKGDRIATVQDKVGCKRYIAVRIDNVKVQESPWEVQRKLIQAGLRPINLIVDLTNLVMIELAQPLHAFDARYADRIVVRKAKKGEKLIALNGKEYALESTDCVIVNSKEPMALAGIIGGEHSGIQADTTSIVLESATFEPVMIRKTSQRLQLRTDSSARFEKGQPVEMANRGVRRFLWLLNQYQSSVVLHHVESIGQDKTSVKKVTVDGAWLDRLIGVGVVPFSATKKILQGLGMKVIGSAKRFTVVPPFWRNDIEISADVAEEVSRLHGFNIIPHALPTLPIQPAPEDSTHTLIDELKTFLVERCGFTETESYPFAQSTIPAQYPRFQVVSPISEENTELRDDLVPAVVSGVAKNLRYFDVVRIFEIGREFQSEHQSTDPRGAEKKSGMLPYQPIHCVGGIAQKGANEEELFFRVKGVVESWAAARHYTIAWAAPKDAKGIASGVGYEPGRCLTILINGQAVGNIGIIGKDWQTRLDSPLPVAIFDVQLDLVMASTAGSIRYQPSSPYPPALRDIAIVVDAPLPYERVAALFLSHGNFLQRFELFDSYTGQEVGEGKKSLAFHLTFSDPTKTLTNQEVDASMEKLIQKLRKDIGATIRN